MLNCEFNKSQNCDSHELFSCTTLQPKLLEPMESTIEKIIQGNPENIPEALKNFIDIASTTFSFPELAKGDKRKEIWDSLFNLAKTSINPLILSNLFTAIRILSREKDSLNDLITEDWMELIQTHSGLDNDTFSVENLPLAVEVEKCLCNLVFNSKVAANMCCKNGILERLAGRVKKNNAPSEIIFFDVKLIFLLTALRPEIRQRVKEDMAGATSLVKLLEVTLPDAIEKEEKLDFVSEILKALFNLTLNCYGCNEDEDECARLVSILRLYLLIPMNNPEKQDVLHGNIINLMTNMPGECFVHLYTPVRPEQNIAMKLQFEGQNMTAVYEILNYVRSKLVVESGVTKKYEILSPALTVLVNGAINDRIVRKYLRSRILPPLKDVHNRPEQGSTVRNHLCRLLTTPITQLRDLVAELLFVLCKKSVSRMIKYTGYGNAAGLFAQRGLLGGRPDKGEADYSSDSGDSETEEYAEFKHGINPVIGCYQEPHASPMDNMTEEQKEYEAMKLVELMDNLTRSGTIKPCRVGPDGKPQPIEHILELQAGLKSQQRSGSDSD